MSYWPRDTDTEHVRTLGNEIRVAEEHQSILRERVRRYETQIDELRLLQRPEFPTAEQDALIGLAASEIHAARIPKSHHGDPVVEGNYTVVVDGHRGFISVRDGAPYAARGSSEKLWAFTDEERNAILYLVEANGLEVTSYWPHAEGLSIIARPQR